MKPGDVGIYLPASTDRASLRSLVRGAEDAHVHSVWFTEADLQRDPLVHASAAAMLTDKLHIGLGLVNVWKQLPVALATATANLAHLAAGGCSLVLGPWHEPAASQHGADRRELIEAMTDATLIVRQLLHGETVTHAGRVFTAADVRLPARDHADSVPLLWGANGPRMVAAAADLAARGVLDGVMVNYLTNIDRVAEIIEVVKTRATGAGRDPATLRFPIAAIIDLDDDKDAAVERMRSFIEASPLLRHEARLPAEGPVQFDEVESRLVAGTPEQCRARIEGFLAVGAGPVALYSRNPEAVLDRLFEPTTGS